MAIYLTKRSVSGTNNSVKTNIIPGNTSIIKSEPIIFGRRGSILIDVVVSGNTSAFSFVIYYILDSTGITYSEKEYIGDNINVDATLSVVGGNVDVSLTNNEIIAVDVFARLI